MKMKLSKVIENYKSLSSLEKKKLPIKLSYVISKNLDKLKTETDIIEQNRIKLAESFAKRNEDGSPIIEDNKYIIENQSEFVKELNEYFDTEIDVDICTLTMFDIEKLDEPRYDALTPLEMSALYLMLAEENIQMIE